MPAERLRIERFHVNCLVSEDHPAPERIRRYMADVVETIVPNVLSGIVERSFGGGDESMWFIKRLDLAFDVNASGDAHDVARSIAWHTTRAVAAEMSAVDARNVVRFDNPDQFLAAFLADVADGTAWQHWYYQGFRGLELLPTSTVLRTAICEDLQIGLSALRHLQSSVFMTILDRLGDADARRIWEAIEAEAVTAEVPTEDVLHLALQILKRASGDGFGPEKLALRLLVELARSNPSQGRMAVSLCLNLAACVRCLDDVDRETRVQLLRSLAICDTSLLFQSAGTQDAETIAPLLQLPECLRLRIVQECRQVVDQKNESAFSQTSNVQATSFGGAFFLLPVIDEFSVLRGLIPDSPNFRWGVLVRCFGQARVAAASQDPLLRELTGLTPEIEEEFEEHGQPLRVLAEHVLTHFAGRLPGFASSTPEYLYKNFLNCEARIEREEHRSIVTIGPAPLSLILNVAGINRQHYELSWFRGHRFELYPTTG
jgi:hypothetical protein